MRADDRRALAHVPADEGASGSLVLRRHAARPRHRSGWRWLRAAPGAATAIDDTLLVADCSLLIGMRLLHSHAGLDAEPSAAAGVTAILENPQRFRGPDVGTIICDGNVADDRMRRWLGVG